VTKAHRTRSTVRHRVAGGAGRAGGRALVSLLLALSVVALACSSATAFRGHAFASDFGWGVSDGKGEFQLCAKTKECKAGIAGAEDGQFKEPSDVAVNEASGHVYVLDQGNGRVQVFGHDEKYISQFNGTSATGTGTLTSGSSTIESVTTATGAFSVGQEVSAPGLLAGTTITALTGGGVLKVSQPATTSESASLAAHQSFAFGTVALSGAIAIDNSCYQEKLSGAACTASDPSNGDVYVTDPGNHVVDKFSAEGTYLGQLEECPKEASCHVFEFGRLAGIGVDASGTAWVYQQQEAKLDVSGNVERFTNGEPSRFVSARQLENVGGFVCPGFAVDSEDDLYTRKAGNQPGCSITPSVFKFDTSGGGLLAPFAAEETSAVAVDLSSDEVFLDNVSSVGAFSSGAAQQERFGSGEIEDGAGLAVDHESSTDSTVYVADFSANRVDVFGPEPPGKPSIEGQSLTKVTATSARLQAEIDPHGSSTQFHFQYGRCVTPTTCASSPYEKSIPVPEELAGADFEVHSVSANPQDLVPGTVYHFRVLAHNALNEAGTVVEGQEQIFTTQAGGVFELPDGRLWEMVSPIEKHGAAFLPIGAAGVVQASASGDAITYVATGPTESQPQGNANNSQVLSTRSGGGWGSRDIAPPHEGASGQSVGQGQEYRFFSSDLSLGVVQRFGAFDPSLSPEATEQTPYLRTSFLNGNPSEFCTSDCFRPLVTGANTPEGTQFGEEGKCPPLEVCGPRFVGATPDLSHVVLNSNAPLTETQVKGGLYEWSAGQLSLISVLPGGEGGAAVAGAFGDSSVANSRGAISSDGSRVVWMTNGSQPHLYLYEKAKEGSVRLDPGLTGTPEFQIASTNVSGVLFTEKGDLYRYDVEGEELHRLTEGAGVVGRLPGASEDGSYVYFVGNGALAEGAVKGSCGEEFSPAGKCNLYVLHGGVIGLVAVLSGEDSPDWSPFLVHQTARVSPNGRYLAFMSNQPLSGYDNRDALSGKRDEEVFLYDAQQQRLACASCDPTGARPLGQEYHAMGFKSLAGGDAVWQNQQWLAADIPGWTPYRLGTGLYQSRYLSDNGRLFFNSNEALSPQDVNGTWDVYQYEPPSEPPSVGSCNTSSPTFGERSGGCVALISSGTSPEESGFLDASESGSDVFFLTAAKLSSQDTDTALDVYDAHVCASASPCLTTPAPPPPPCITEASCRPAPTPQPEIFGFPASATFSGIGNIAPAPPALVKPKSAAQIRAERLAKALKACRKKSKKKRPPCEKQARRKYGPVGKKAKKSNRRAR
jgi:hypothetical protein